jgi:hypothetical protein
MCVTGRNYAHSNKQYDFYRGGGGSPLCKTAHTKPVFRLRIEVLQYKSYSDEIKRELMVAGWFPAETYSNKHLRNI